MSARLPVAVLGGVVVVAAVLAFAWRKHSQTPADAGSAPPPVASKPLVDTAAHCELIQTHYREELAKLQSCTSDDECVAERRDGVLSGLDGCARFYRHDANLRTSVEPLANTWLARGCSGTYMTCRDRQAQCVAGQCTELPPAPVPRTWKRITHTTAFSFFVPSEAIEKKVIGEDSEVGEWDLPKYTVQFDYGYGTNIEGTKDEGDKVLHREPFAFGEGQGELLVTHFHRGEFTSGAQIRHVPNRYGRDVSLTLWADCKTEADCADGAIIARSLEFH